MSYRILVVDDYPSAAQIACMLLELLGHEARPAKSGREALALAPELAPQIVILDLELPDQSGFEVARALRVELPGPLFLAALTGSAHPEDRARSIAAGFDCHVLKPADGAKLRELVERADRKLSGGKQPRR
jgi:CheY-like chemotaxis protein